MLQNCAGVRSRPKAESFFTAAAGEPDHKSSSYLYARWSYLLHSLSWISCILHDEALLEWVAPRLRNARGTRSMASERRKWPGKPPQELLDRPDIADMFHWSQPPEMAICFAEIAKGRGLPCLADVRKEQHERAGGFYRQPGEAGCTARARWVCG